MINTIHILNKKGVGGAENLVNSLLDKQIDQNDQPKHSVSYIANSQFSKFLIGQRILRFVPILLKCLELFILICKFRIYRREINLFLIFHLAECHLIARILSFLPSFFNKISFIIYLHQSKELFPPKIVPTTTHLLGCFPSICYSASATNSWYSNVELKNYRFVIHNAVSRTFSIKNKSRHKKDFDSIQLLFIGRFVPWKRADRALAFAKKVSLLKKTTLTLVGIDKSQFLEAYGQEFIPANNLELNFVGISDDVESYIKSSCLLVNLFDTHLSGECIGVAAMEALSMGIPVLTPNGQSSDFLHYPGVYQLSEMVNHELDSRFMIESALSKLLSGKLFLSAREIEFWRKKVSIDRYNRDLNSLLVSMVT